MNTIVRRSIFIDINPVAGQAEVNNICGLYCFFECPITQGADSGLTTRPTAGEKSPYFNPATPDFGNLPFYARIIAQRPAWPGARPCSTRVRTEGVDARIISSTRTCE